MVGAAASRRASVEIASSVASWPNGPAALTAGDQVDPHVPGHAERIGFEAALGGVVSASGVLRGEAKQLEEGLLDQIVGLAREAPSRPKKPRKGPSPRSRRPRRGPDPLTEGHQRVAVPWPGSFNGGLNAPHRRGGSPNRAEVRDLHPSESEGSRASLARTMSRTSPWAAPTAISPARLPPPGAWSSSRPRRSSGATPRRAPPI